MAHPVRAAFFVPKNFTPPYDVRAAARVVRDWMLMNRAGFLRETGWTYDLHFVGPVMLSKTKEEMARDDKFVSGGFLDDLGQGLHTSEAHWAMEQVFPKSEDASDHLHRWTGVFANGGGYAGGSQDADFSGGYAFWGDWFIRPYLLKQPTPEAITRHGVGFASIGINDPWKAPDGLGHEQSHMWGVALNPQHSPNLYTWSTMPEQAKQTILERNKPFLVRPMTSARRTYWLYG